VISSNKLANKGKKTQKDGWGKHEEGMRHHHDHEYCDKRREVTRLKSIHKIQTNYNPRALKKKILTQTSQIEILLVTIIYL
jgi:hypothetical protein